MAEQRFAALAGKGRLDHQVGQCREYRLEGLRLAAPAGVERGQRQLLAQQAATGLRQEAEQAGRFQHPAAQRVGHQYAPLAYRLEQAGNAQRRVGTQFQRVAEVVIEAPQYRVHPFQAAEGLEIEGGVAHRQVVPLDQRETELARQVEMLEVGFVETSGSQQHHQRRLAVAGGLAGEGLLQGAEIPGEMLHAQVAIEFRQGPRDDLPVLQRIARAGRRLGAVGEDLPASVGIARQVDGIAVQEDPAGRPDAERRPEEVRMAEDQFAGQQPFGEQTLLAVQVGQQRVEQPSTLCHAGGDRLPLGGGQQVRQKVQRPGAVGALGIGVDIVGDAVLLDLPFHQGLALAQLLRAAALQLAEQPLPMGTHATLAIEQLMVGRIGERIVGKQLGHRRLAGLGLRSL